MMQHKIRLAVPWIALGRSAKQGEESREEVAVLYQKKRSFRGSDMQSCLTKWISSTPSACAGCTACGCMAFRSGIAMH